MGVLNVLLGLKIVLPVMVSTMGGMVIGVVSYNFIAQKSCSPDGIPDDINDFICPNMTILDQVNDITTTANSFKTACAALGSSAFGLIRDVSGKSRPLLFVGILAELITVCTYLMCTIYWSSSPWIPPLVQTFVSGGFGEAILHLGANCLLMQESTPEELPMRLQIFMTANLFLMTISQTLTTMILTTLGYRWLFTLSISLHVIALLLVMILVKEKNNTTKSLKDSFDGVKNIFKWRENVVVLWLLLFIGPITMAILTAESSNNSTFFQEQLRFSMYETSGYSTYHFSLCIIGSVLIPYLLRKFFDCKHLTIGIIGSLMNSVGPIMMAFVTTELGLYLVSILNSSRLVTLPLPNTVISSIVNQNEIGTYLGFAAIVTIWVPYSITKIYRYVFSRTEETWIGAYFFLSSGFFILVAFIFSVCYCLYIEPQKPEEATISTKHLEIEIENGRGSLESKSDKR